LRRHRKRDARDEDRGHFGWSSLRRASRLCG
jgi:hypothetical protein